MTIRAGDTRWFTEDHKRIPKGCVCTWEYDEQWELWLVATHDVDCPHHGWHRAVRTVHASILSAA